MSIPPFTRRVNVGRLKPVVDPFRKRSASGATDPDELPPPCGRCGSETLWFQCPRTTLVQLVCLTCQPYQPTDEFPEADGRKAVR